MPIRITLIPRAVKIAGQRRAGVSFLPIRCGALQRRESVQKRGVHSSAGGIGGSLGGGGGIGGGGAQTDRVSSLLFLSSTFIRLLLLLVDPAGLVLWACSGLLSQDWSLYSSFFVCYTKH